jgi:predicted RNA-binding Zn-ribbon protein involved in translation (DUF1610 family)
MEKITGFWDWIQSNDWIGWLTSLGLLGWVLLVVGVGIALALWVKTEFTRGCGSVLLVFGLLVVALVVALILGLEYATAAGFFLPVLVGLLVGSVAGSPFSSMEKGQKCPHCGGRIVHKSQQNAEGHTVERIYCSKCGYKWHEGAKRL